MKKNSYTSPAIQELKIIMGLRNMLCTSPIEFANSAGGLGVDPFLMGGSGDIYISDWE